MLLQTNEQVLLQRFLYVSQRWHRSSRSKESKARAAIQFDSLTWISIKIKVEGKFEISLVGSHSQDMTFATEMRKCESHIFFQWIIVYHN